MGACCGTRGHCFPTGWSPLTRVAMTPSIGTVLSFAFLRLHFDERGNPPGGGAIESEGSSPGFQIVESL